jgi:hypothetical protein
MRVEDWQSNIVKDVDGFVYYWPDGAGGMYGAHHLRDLAKVNGLRYHTIEALNCIADELDRRNAPWQATIDDYFEGSL